MIEVTYAGISSALCWLAVTTINRMGRDTHAGIRGSYILIAIGALGQLLWSTHAATCVTGSLHETSELLISIGATLLVFFDRRYRKPWRERQ